ncbi:MAG: transposase [Actinobacteria bacterium]|nr:transposase [Actinomycetota bacterium]
MCQVPSSLAGLLSLCRPAFTQPSFQTFSMLLVGFLGRIRDCTVTGMLQAAGLAGEWHHSRAHDFFARARWDPDELGLRLVDFLVSVFVAAGAPIRLAVDDTLFGRSGRKVFGAHYLHDGAQPEGSGRRTRWGNCWVVVVLVVELECLGGRQVGLPILFRLFRPKDDARPELDRDRPSQPELARLLIDMILRRFPTRIVHLVCDGAYASKAWQGLPERVTVTSRMRSNAAVYALPAAQRRPGQQGRTALKGAKLASLAQIAATAVFSAVTITGRDGRTRTAHIHEFVCLWYTPFYTRPVKVILIRDPGRSEGFDVALASTDLDAAGAQLIARYDSRWSIETAHQEAKAHGVGDARNRVEKAVQRTVPFGFLAQTITIAWYALHGDPEADLQARRRAAPWYRQKTTVSYADMLAALRRQLIRHEFWAQAPQMTTNTKLTQPQTPSALAAA